MKCQYRAVLLFDPPPLALTFIWNNSENNGNVLEFSFTLKFSCIFHGMWPRQSSKFNTPTNEFNLDTNADLKNYSMSQSGQKCSTDAIIMCRTVGVPISVHLSLRFQSSCILKSLSFPKPEKFHSVKDDCMCSQNEQPFPTIMDIFATKILLRINFWWKTCFNTKY